MQRRILDTWRGGDEFFWADEWRNSLDAFAKIAPLSIGEWNVGYPGTYVSFTMDEDDNYGNGIEELSGVRAWKWLVNNGWKKLADGQDCPFTGYCGDETLLDPIREALANPSRIVSLYDVFNDCLQSWAHGFEADIDHWESDEAIREDIYCGGYEFYDDGTIA